jgi:hypothetical protein
MGWEHFKRAPDSQHSKAGSKALESSAGMGMSGDARAGACMGGGLQRT